MRVPVFIVKVQTMDEWKCLITVLNANSYSFHPNTEYPIPMSDGIYVQNFLMGSKNEPELNKYLLCGPTIYSNEREYLATIQEVTDYFNLTKNNNNTVQFDVL